MVHQQLKLPDQVSCQRGDHPMRLLSQELLPEVVFFRIQSAQRQAIPNNITPTTDNLDNIQGKSRRQTPTVRYRSVLLGGKPHHCHRIQGSSPTCQDMRATVTGPRTPFLRRLTFEIRDTLQSYTLLTKPRLQRTGSIPRRILQIPHRSRPARVMPTSIEWRPHTEA